MRSFLGLLLVLAAACHNEITVHPAESPEGERMFVTWEIESLQLGTVACEEAGAISVTIDAIEVTSGDQTTFGFPCSAYQGTTSPELPGGTFDVQVALLDAVGFPLSSAELGEVLVAQTGTIDLGHVIFQVR